MFFFIKHLLFGRGWKDYLLNEINDSELKIAKRIPDGKCYIPYIVSRIYTYSECFLHNLLTVK